MTRYKEIAREFYTAMGQKNMDHLEKGVHPDIHFKGPLDEFKGKETYLTVVRNFTALLEGLNIRSVMAENNQAIVVYDVLFPEPIGTLPGVAFITFEDDLIRNVELVYDSQKIISKKDEIFS
jgi:hypothetical protein